MLNLKLDCSSGVIVPGIDGGIGYSYDPQNLDSKAAWATSMSEKVIDRRISEADVIAIVSGSPDKMHFSNKKSSDVFGEELKAAISKAGEKEVNIIKDLKDLIVANEAKKFEKIKGFVQANNSAIKSVDDFTSLLKEQGSRGAFIQMMLPDQTKKHGKGTVQKLMQDLGMASVQDINSNLVQPLATNLNFELGDVINVIEPTGFGQAGAGDLKNVTPHSTYSNVIKGNALGIPSSVHKMWDFNDSFKVYDKKTNIASM